MSEMGIMANIDSDWITNPIRQRNEADRWYVRFPPDVIVVCSAANVGNGSKTAISPAFNVCQLCARKRTKPSALKIFRFVPASDVPIITAAQQNSTGPGQLIVWIGSELSSTFAAGGFPMESRLSAILAAGFVCYL